MKRILFLLIVCCQACSSPDAADFIRVKDGKFVRDGKNYYYIGMNFWYGAVLGSEGRGGDRERLKKELDILNANGVNNLRILVGADGDAGVLSKIEPALQLAPGVYNDTVFKGLDYLLAEMGKRDMHAVLFLTNSWEWSGGFSQYLEWTGHGKAKVPAVDGWAVFHEYVSAYAGCDTCHRLLKEHIGKVVTRKNSYTGRYYNEDPTIMSWQIANEPRAFGDKNKALFEKWMLETARYIKSLAPLQLVSTGSEGEKGCEGDFDLYERIHSNEAVDYYTIHIWPQNWRWLDPQHVDSTYASVEEKTKGYIEQHLTLARRANKPLVLEEFGFPREGFSLSDTSATAHRDRYYEFVFRRLLASADAKDSFAGCNVWAWGGLGRGNALHLSWRSGDDYTGDPAQEPQGLNSVFDTDQAVSLVKDYNMRLCNAGENKGVEK